MDYRGRWAAQLSNAMNLPEWKVIENRLDVKNADSSISAFVGFKTLGLTIWDELTPNFFRDKSMKLIGEVFDLEGAPRTLPIERIGVRRIQFATSDHPFSAVLKRYSELTTSPAFLQLIPGPRESMDVAILVLNQTPFGGVRIASGPAAKGDQETFMQGHPKRKPEDGYYTDVDTFYRPAQPEMMAAKKLEQIVGTLEREGRTITERVLAAVAL
jgi:hypothetical protein